MHNNIKINNTLKHLGLNRTLTNIVAGGMPGLVMYSSKYEINGDSKALVVPDEGHRSLEIVPRLNLAPFDFLRHFVEISALKMVTVCFSALEMVTGNSEIKLF